MSTIIVHIGAFMTGRKIFSDADAALDGILFDGMTIMSGGFGLSGNPEHLIEGLRRKGTKDLTIISHNCGADGFGLWQLLTNVPPSKMTSSSICDTKLFPTLKPSGTHALALHHT